MENKNLGTRILVRNSVISEAMLIGIPGDRAAVAQEIDARLQKWGFSGHQLYIGGHHVALIFKGSTVVTVTSDNPDFQ
jgi:hypothetical protein